MERRANAEEAELSAMDVELLVIPECPHTAGAQRLLRDALDDLGQPEQEIAVTVVVDGDDANRLAFVGSPTFRAGGRDLFPMPGALPSWSCRLYPGTTATAGLPNAAELTSALAKALASPT